MRALLLLFTGLCFLACQSTPNQKEKSEVDMTNAFSDYEEALTLPTGQFGDFLLAYDGNQVTGMYQSVIGNGQFSCAFFLQAQLKEVQEQFEFTWYYPGEEEQHRGTLQILAEDAIKISLQGNPGGQCLPELLGDGERLQLNETESWKAVRVVHRAANIFEEANPAMQLPAQLPPFSVICVMEQHDNWIRFEEPKEGGKMGWIKIDKLYPLL